MVFEHAGRLLAKGHEMNVVYPRKIYANYNLKYRLRQTVKDIRESLSGKSVSYDPDTLLPVPTEVPSLHERFIPESDIIVATGWVTALWTNRYGADKGRKIYFIQHYEDWWGPKGKKDGVDVTWTIPLRKIVVSSWLRNLSEKKFNQKVFGVVSNGVDLDIFYNKNKQYNNVKQLCMMYHKMNWKGLKYGIKAIAEVKRHYPHLRIVMFGFFPSPKLPFKATYYRDPSLEKLREIYSSSDIFVSPSLSEGFNLPPMEAMACQCAVIATDVGAVSDYAEEGKTALICRPGDSHALFTRIRLLLEDEQLLKTISMGGYRKVAQFTWEKSNNKLEAFFQEALLTSNVFC